MKDGWEPLCHFLGKPVPADPIPHDNKTGDTGIVQIITFKFTDVFINDKSLRDKLLSDSNQLTLKIFYENQPL